MDATQICVKCGVEKLLSEYFNNTIKKNGKDSKCKECRKKHNKIYEIENSEKLKVIRKKWYADNHDQILNDKHEYYKENRAAILKNKSEYRLKNLDKIRVRIKKWTDDNAEHVVESHRVYRQSIINQVLDLLGQKCVTCGLDIKEFLTIDHVNNDGNTERSFGSLGWKRRILNGESDKTRYQVLCHNCNNKKYRINPIHQLKVVISSGITKICNICLKEKDVNEFPSQLSHGSNRCLPCRRIITDKFRQSCLTLLGGKCVCCGEKDLYKLTLDHKYNDGSACRKIGEGSGIDLYKKLVKKPSLMSKYQLLCWNCNYSKYIGNGVCYHNRSNIDVIDFSFDSIVISQVLHSPDVTEFLDKYHYAGFGRASKVIFVAKIQELVVAVIKFATPVRQGIAHTLDLNHGEVLELDRFCIDPSYHKKNFASYLMSRVIKKVSSAFPEIKCLVSFADPRFGHVGTIYKASNWEEVGQTTSSYVYVDKDGNEINKKSVYDKACNLKLKEREYVDKLGLTKIAIPAKIKYIYRF